MRIRITIFNSERLVVNHFAREYIACASMADVIREGTFWGFIFRFSILILIELNQEATFGRLVHSFSPPTYRLKLGLLNLHI